MIRVPRRAWRPAILAGFLLFAAAVPARADITAFLGVSPTPDNHGARGFAIGASIIIVGFEFEYSRIAPDELEVLPELKTWSGNVFAQTPMDLAGMRLYATTGLGGYRETLVDNEVTNLAFNVGGGAKIGLAGPLGVRVDYRIFTLKGEPSNSTYQRFYVGANLRF